jgi:hypothetical protein
MAMDQVLPMAFGAAELDVVSGQETKAKETKAEDN